MLRPDHSNRAAWSISPAQTTPISIFRHKVTRLDLDRVIAKRCADGEKF
jgi:hypothetical protein